MRFWDGGGGYAPGLRKIDGDIASLGGFASDANEFTAIIMSAATLFSDGFE